jgi:hypothetical protein
MALNSWIGQIQGLTTVLSGSAAAIARRSTIKVVGQSVFDDGTQTVLGGVQALAGTGSWDGQSSIVQVAGSGARLITLIEPLDPHSGLQILVVEVANQAGVVTIDPTGAGTINNAATLALAAAGFTFARLMWLSANTWVRVS